MRKILYCVKGRILENFRSENKNEDEYNTKQYSLFNEGDVINLGSYLTYGLHNGTKYTYKTMPNQQNTAYKKRN